MTELKMKTVSAKYGRPGWFLEDYDGDITLRYRDKKDNFAWYVASVLPDGTMCLHGSLGEDIGLKLKRGGTVKVVREVN